MFDIVSEGFEQIPEMINKNTNTNTGSQKLREFYKIHIYLSQELYNSGNFARSEVFHISKPRNAINSFIAPTFGIK